jgi:hypothetical protein
MPLAAAVSTTDQQPLRFKKPKIASAGTAPALIVQTCSGAWPFKATRQAYHHCTSRGTTTKRSVALLLGCASVSWHLTFRESPNKSPDVMKYA